uniref:Uncharacterized protein n=1 Tax=Rhizophora mucronata TaxID=61149 RepID=A0A2P2N498_RHIMU
MTEQINMVDP